MSRDLPSRPGDYGRIDEASGYQIGGSHYLGHAHQPWDIIQDWGLDFWEGNALKYLLRRKPGTARSEDLRKAMHYLERACERAEAAECQSA